MLKDTRIGKLVENLEKITEEFLWFETLDTDEFKKQYVDWIQQQLQSGEDGDGNVMGVYSMATEIITGGEKQEGDPFNMKSSGDYYNSMFLVVTFEGLQLEAEYEKEDGTELNIEYGEQIDKLNDENFEILKEKVKEKYLSIIREILSES